MLKSRTSPWLTILFIQSTFQDMSYSKGYYERQYRCERSMVIEQQHPNIRLAWIDVEFNPGPQNESNSGKEWNSEVVCLKKSIKYRNLFDLRPKASKPDSIVIDL